ncbi:MAG: ABC transporter ATP-binding protein [Cyanobacteria bacterium P01_A01_bin.45]
MAQVMMHHQGEKPTFESPLVELRNVHKFFNKEAAVEGIDIDIRKGEFFSILGPSGCGKTTILRLIAGFEKVDEGSLFIQGQCMNRIPPFHRPVNTVFQSYALFHHLNVWDNVAFGLRLKKLRRKNIESKIEEILKLVKMDALRSRYPHQLSGGQQQRVALARALVNYPAVILLDEPLGALDLKLRKQMQVELSNLHKNLGLTMIMVTHDQEEALSLSDRVAVMNHGKIEQIGEPSQIYEHPQTAFVASFIGDSNLLSAEIIGVNKQTIEVMTKAGLKIIVDRTEDTPIKISQTIAVGIRPEKIQLSLYKPSVQNNCFEGKIRNIMYLGTHINYIVELAPGINITVRQSNTFGDFPSSNTHIYAWWEAKDCLALLTD